MLKIGEFARVACVSTVLLRHYDDIGLLKPAQIDRRTGYRYYELEQLPRLNRILALKGLGLSLEEVARLLTDDVSPATIRDLLHQRKLEIERTLTEEQHRLSLVEARLARIDAEGSPPEHEILIKPVDTLHVLAMHITPTPERTLSHTFWEAWEAVRRFDYDFAVCVHHYSYDDSNPQLCQIGYAVDPDHVPESIRLSEKREMVSTWLPPVERMAYVVNRGDDAAEIAARQALHTWMAAHGYHMAGPLRTLYLRRYSDDEPQQGNITEIQIPVTS